MGFQVCKDAGPVARIFRLSPESTTNSFWRMGARPGATVRRAAAMAWAAVLLAASLTWGAPRRGAQAMRWALEGNGDGVHDNRRHDVGPAEHAAILLRHHERTGPERPRSEEHTSELQSLR